MKRIVLLSACMSVLTACTQQNISHEPTLEYQLENPLFAERFAEAIVDRMVELVIQEDERLQDTSYAKNVENIRSHWQEVARDAVHTQTNGLFGEFVPAEEYTTGKVLLLNNEVFFGANFDMDPGPEVRVYLTKVVDPRDEVFPDDSAIDLGPLHTAIGAQRYTVPESVDTNGVRTVVLFERQLERIHGFAQITN